MIDNTLLELIRLMPSIGKCEYVKDEYNHSQMYCMIGASSYKRPKPPSPEETDNRMQFELKYNDFIVNVKVDRENYYCRINGGTTQYIQESTYNTLNEYCKKYEYGDLNHEILSVRLGNEMRVKKLERIVGDD